MDVRISYKQGKNVFCTKHYEPRKHLPVGYNSNATKHSRPALTMNS